MQDRFKFRVWDKVSKRYFFLELKFGDNGYHPCFIEKPDFEQCTGLKDKNGKLIYEGDILKCVHSDIMKYKIYWSKFGGFRMKVYGTDNSVVDDCHIFYDENILEVIGNIHENKELIDD